MTWLVLTGLGIFLLLLLALFGPDPRIRRIPAEKRQLKVTAQKGLLSCSITNREFSPIRTCDLYVIDAQDVRWSVYSTMTIQPLETVSFDWKSFTAEGQPMPSAIGRDRGFYVSCLVTGSNERLEAAFR